jgi:hypothetical protein
MCVCVCVCVYTPAWHNGVVNQIRCLTTTAGVQVFFGGGPHNQNFICVCRPHELNIFHLQRTRKSQVSYLADNEIQIIPFLLSTADLIENTQMHVMCCSWCGQYVRWPRLKHGLVQYYGRVFECDSNPHF